jgi:hypothetical protein
MAAADGPPSPVSEEPRRHPRLTAGALSWLAVLVVAIVLVGAAAAGSGVKAGPPVGLQVLDATYVPDIYPYWRPGAVVSVVLKSAVLVDERGGAAAKTSASAGCELTYFSSGARERRHCYEAR